MTSRTPRGGDVLPQTASQRAREAAAELLVSMTEARDVNVDGDHDEVTVRHREGGRCSWCCLPSLCRQLFGRLKAGPSHQAVELESRGDSEVFYRRFSDITQATGGAVEADELSLDYDEDIFYADGCLVGDIHKLAEEIDREHTASIHSTSQERLGSTHSGLNLNAPSPTIPEKLTPSLELDVLKLREQAIQTEDGALHSFCARCGARTRSTGGGSLRNSQTESPGGGVWHADMDICASCDSSATMWSTSDSATGDFDSEIVIGDSRIVRSENDARVLESRHKMVEDLDNHFLQLSRIHSEMLLKEAHKRGIPTAWDSDSSVPVEKSKTRHMREMNDTYVSEQETSFIDSNESLLSGEEFLTGELKEENGNVTLEPLSSEDYNFHREDHEWRLKKEFSWRRHKTMGVSWEQLISEDSDEMLS